MTIASVMLPLGTPALPFFLPDVVSGQVYTLDSFHGKDALLVMFICRHCPYVKHVEEELAKIGKDYQNKKRQFPKKVEDRYGSASMDQYIAPSFPSDPNKAVSALHITPIQLFYVSDPPVCSFPCYVQARRTLK